MMLGLRVALVCAVLSGAVGCECGDGADTDAGMPDGAGGDRDGSVSFDGDVPENDAGPVDLTPIELDDTFGDDGIVRVQSIGSTDWVWGADRAPDGDLLAGGGTTNGLGRRQEAIVVRFDGTDGSLDESWGVGGVALLDFHDAPTITAVVALADGGAMIGGYSQYGTQALAFVARLGADGTLDATFGTGGIVSFEGDNSGVTALALGAGGVTYALSAVRSSRAVVRRLTADGSIDTTFGTEGVAEVLGAEPRELVVRDDGSLLALVDNFLTHVSAGGVVDTEFGDQGSVRFLFDTYAFEISPSGDELVVVGGAAGTASIIKLDATTGEPVAFGTNATLLVPGTTEGLVDVEWLETAGIVVLEGEVVNFPAAQPVAVHRMNADGTGVALVSNTIGGRGSHLSHLFATETAIYLVGSVFDLAVTEVEVHVRALDHAGAAVSGFGTDGLARSRSGATTELFWDMARRADGSVVATGPAFIAGLLVRFAGGAQDLTFGEGGWVNTNPIVGPFIGVGADGDRILGAVGDELVRLNADGTPDSNFAEMGEFLDAPDSSSLHAVAADAEGRILGAGEIIAGQALIIRLTSDGIPDATFDGDGIVMNPAGDTLRASLLAVLPEDDGIVVSGIGTTLGVRHTVLLRLELDGSLDTSFGDEGVVTIDGGPSGWRLVPRQGGGYLVSGSSLDCRDGDCPVSVVALRADGSVDSGFGDAGIASVIGRYYAGPMGLTQLSDGSILLGGAVTGARSEELAIWRLAPDGRPDPAFGTDGALVLTGHRGRVTAMIPDGDGALAAGWHSSPTTGTDAILLRLRAP
jgi:uncharacterized delta-60 repeat protein